MTQVSDRVFLTKEQAKSVLAEHPHSLKQSNCLRAFLGIDLTHDQAMKLIDESTAIEIAGFNARRMGHAIMIYSPDETGRALNHNEAKLAALEKSLIDSGRQFEAAPQWWHEEQVEP